MDVVGTRRPVHMTSRGGKVRLLCLESQMGACAGRRDPTTTSGLVPSELRKCIRLTYVSECLFVYILCNLFSVCVDFYVCVYERQDSTGFSMGIAGVSLCDISSVFTDSSAVLH